MNDKKIKEIEAGITSWLNGFEPNTVDCDITKHNGGISVKVIDLATNESETEFWKNKFIEEVEVSHLEDYLFHILDKLDDRVES